MDTFLILEPISSSVAQAIFMRVGIRMLRNDNRIFDLAVQQVVHVV